MRRIEAPDTVKDYYNKYCDFMEKNVEFSYEVSELHTKEHCSRVLLFALLIAEELKLTEEEKDLLGLCASFHDSRRQDDWLDVGHGRRAAEYYKAYCEKHKVRFESWVYCIMAYHDLDDRFGEKTMEPEITGRQVLLYHIFKDADALDRFRLGPDGLDVKYLRTDAAKGLCGYAKNVWNTYYV